MPRSVDSYLPLWQTMRITRPGAVEQAAQRCLSFKDKYVAVDRATGVPWRMIAALHMRESDNDFRGVLHNGEHILGTGRKTRLEPRGRGPFETWGEAAMDALRIKGIVGKLSSYWDMGHILWHCEAFNGWGYVGRGNSPYVWAGSQHYTRGKYVADHVYSSSTVDPQLGVAPVMKRMMELDSVHPEGQLVKVPLGLGIKAWMKKTIAATGIGTLVSWNTVSEVQGFITQHQLVLLLAAGVGLWLLLNWLEGGPKNDAQFAPDVAEPDPLV